MAVTRNSDEYIEVTILTDAFSEEKAEIAEAQISELPYESFMIEDNSLKAYIQKALYDARALKVLLSGLDFRCTFSARLVPPQNWNESWEREFTPIVVDNKVTVKAPHNKDLKKTRFNITIRPQMAFGTGHHQTTYMMIQSMLELEEAVRGHVVLDMGCGTAVLAILAAKLRAAKVYGIDIDAVAAQSAFDNAYLNRVRKTVETYCGDASLLQAGKYDIILANIHRNIIIMDLRTYSMSLKRGGTVLLSGFYTEDIDAVREEAEAQGLQFVSSKEKDGWACLRFNKPL